MHAAEQVAHAANKLEQATKRVEAAAEVTARRSQPTPVARTPVVDIPQIEDLPPVRLKSRALGVISLSFSKSLNSAKVQAASRDLVAALRYTRGQAIVKNQQAALDLDTQNNTYQAPGKPLVKLPKEMHMTLLTAESEQTGATSGRRWRCCSRRCRPSRLP